MYIGVYEAEYMVVYRIVNADVYRDGVQNGRQCTITIYGRSTRPCILQRPLRSGVHYKIWCDVHHRIRYGAMYSLIYGMVYDLVYDIAQDNEQGDVPNRRWCTMTIYGSMYMIVCTAVYTAPYEVHSVWNIRYR